MTLSSGPSYGGVLCNVPSTPRRAAADAILTNFGVYRPNGIGYKNVDLNISKSFKMPWNHGRS